MPTGSTPVAVAVLTTVTVTWSGSTVGGTAVTGYVVKRYDAVSGVAAAVAGTCAGVVAGTTCTDTPVPLGTWRYSITPAQHAWTGVEGPRSLTVAVTL
jgi:hypothetical protein